MASYQNLFIRTKREIEGIQLDAVLSESHREFNTVTRNPVEFGADIADHITVEPVEVSIIAEVTDTPLGFSSFGEIVNNTTNLFGSATESNVTRSAAAYKRLIDLKNERRLVTIQTKLQTYTDMAILDINTIQDADNSNCVNLLINAVKVNISKSQTVDIPKDVLAEGADQQQSTSETNRGQQNTKEPTNSIINTFSRTLGDLFGITGPAGGN